MLQAIVVTQGRLAHELLNSAERVLGGPIRARSVCLDWEATADQDQAVLKEVLAEYSHDDSILLLTDLPGATPHRVARSLACRRIAVVSGVNLAMVVRLGCLDDDEEREVAEVAEWISKKGRNSVTVDVADGAGDA